MSCLVLNKKDELDCVGCLCCRDEIVAEWNLRGN